MAKIKVEAKRDYFHVRFRPPGRYVTCRVPEWASRVAESVSDGAQVKQCRTRDRKWETQAVMVKRTRGRTKAQAKRIARRIFKKLSS